MKIITRVILCLAFCLLCASFASAQKISKTAIFATEGTFSNISAGEGGDYGGMQIYLTDSDGQFYAAVTIAQGVLLPPVLIKVKAQIETRKIEFTLPKEMGARKFTGTVTADGLTLFENKQRMFLKRKC